MSRRPEAKRPETTARRAVLYVRCSTEEQALEGYSLEYQEAALRAYCLLRGLEVAEVVDAGASGGTPLAGREGGSAVQSLAAGGGSAPSSAGSSTGSSATPATAST